MAKYMGTFFRGNGRDLPVPSEMEVTIQKLSRSDAGRSEDGVMHVNYIRRVRSISFSWGQHSPEDIATLTNFFDSSDYFTLTYQDPDGNMETRTFYAGDIKARLYSWTTRYKRYETFSLNVIER